MPELPEVETTARGLRRELVDRVCSSVGGVDWPRMLPNTCAEMLAEVLIGDRVTGVGRRGKYLTIAFEKGALLVIHRKMAGNVLLQPAAAPCERHTHLSVSFSGGVDLRLVDPRKFSRVLLFLDADESDVYFAARLGIDPVEALTLADLRALLANRRGRLKSVLLDQRTFPGVGNLYCDEALWRARIHPLRTADSLSRHETARLFESLRGVLLEAIERRGTSFSDYRDESGALGEFQHYLNAYGREGLPCSRCGRRILKMVIGARGTHVCPGCQQLSTSSSVRRA
ncbi:MAG: bifunctional DNA-formamidopyrimidine glycosylase/DNA-(apurinic or apyrimidinic site) lyase [Chloroflexota bacterium]